MNKEEYQGWANYPTRAVNMWINNDEGLYEMAREATGPIGLRDLVESLMMKTLDKASLETDLLVYALNKTDWDEILEDLQKE